MLPATIHRLQKRRCANPLERAVPPESSTQGTTGLCSFQALLLQALISRDRGGREQRVPSLMLQGLGTILKEGEGFKRMGVSEGCLAQTGSGGAGEKLGPTTCPCLILEDLKLGSLD